MSVERVYCGEIPERPQEIQMIMSITQFIAVAINKVGATGYNVHPVIGVEHNKTCLYIDIVLREDIKK